MAEKKGKSVQDALERLRQRMDECRAVKSGDIDLHLSGKSGGEYRISFGKGKTTISSAAGRGAGREPLLEVWGDADTIRAIIDGEKDPLKQFLAGRHACSRKPPVPQRGRCGTRNSRQAALSPRR